MEWKVERHAHVPNKAWIIDGNGQKITKLIGTKTAQIIVAAHNKEISYLKETTND